MQEGPTYPVQAIILPKHGSSMPHIASMDLNLAITAVGSFEHQHTRHTDLGHLSPTAPIAKFLDQPLNFRCATPKQL